MESEGLRPVGTLCVSEWFQPLDVPVLHASGDVAQTLEPLPDLFLGAVEPRRCDDLDVDIELRLQIRDLSPTLVLDGIRERREIASDTAG